MKESPKNNQYNNPRILFIEATPSFSRYDIIERIKRILSYTSNLAYLGLLYYKKGYNLIVCTRSICRHETNDYYKLLDSFLSYCSAIGILHENGCFIRQNIIDKTICLVSGLHSDIPVSTIEHIRKTHRNVYIISLSPISYLASQILIITDILLDKSILYSLR